MKLLIIILGLLFFGLTSNTVLACRCPKGSVEEEYKHTAVVISGKVINIKVQKRLIIWEKRSRSYFARQIRKKVLLKVEVVYKGKITDKIFKTYTATSDGTCGFPFQEGYTYIVYAKFDNIDNKYWTNICTRTTTYNQEEAAELEKLKNNN